VTASDRVRFATSDIGEIVWCWSRRSAKVRHCVGLDRNTAQSGEQSSLAAYNRFRNISLASDAVLERCFCVRRTAGSGLLIVSWRVLPSSVAAHIPTFAAQESAPAKPFRPGTYVSRFCYSNLPDYSRRLGEIHSKYNILGLVSFLDPKPSWQQQFTAPLLDIFDS
jgi:hypothetical protein